MFEGILEQFLQKKLGKYVEGIDKQNLNIGIWSGNILLENLKIRANVFEHLGLPLKLKFGRIKRLQMKVPWTKLSSAPVELVLETLMLVVVPQQPEEWKTVDTWSFQFKKKQLEELAQIIAANLKLEFQQDQEKKGDGFIDKLITKIVDNLQLTIMNIHIRYEDDVSIPDSVFSFGITLKELSINTTNQNWNAVYYDRMQSDNKDKPIFKKLKIDGLAAYLQIGDNYFLNEEANLLKQQNQDDNQIVNTLQNLIGDRMREMFTKTDQKIEGMTYIIQPIVLEIRLTQLTKLNTNQPNLQFEVHLDDFSITLSKLQYEAIFKVIEHIQKYFKFHAKSSMVQKYMYYRPIFPITSQQSESIEQFELRLKEKALERQLTKKKQQEEANMVQTQQPAQNDEDEDEEFFDALDEELPDKPDDQQQIQEEVKEAQLEPQKSTHYEIEQQECKNRNAVEWWKYAIKCTIKDIRVKRGQWNEFRLSNWKKKLYARQMLQLFNKAINEEYAIDIEKLPEDERYLYIHIVQANEVSDLKNWMAIVIKRKVQKHYAKLQQQEKQKDGLLSYIFTWGVHSAPKEESKKQIQEEEDDDFLINEEELDNIRNSLQVSLADMPQLDVNDLDIPSEQKRKLVKVSIICLFKHGSIYLQQTENTANNVEIYQDDLNIQFTLRRDQSFEAVITNRSAGLNIVEKLDCKETKKMLVGKLQDEELEFEVEESKEEQEGGKGSYLWRLNLLNETISDDFSIGFDSNPLKVVYDAQALKDISTFFKLNASQEELRAQAYDKFSSLKNQTQVSFQDLLYKKSNNISIKIASPVIEVPFKSHEEENTLAINDARKWIVNLGNIHFMSLQISPNSSPQKSQEIDEYERFNLKIDSMSFQYLKNQQLAPVLEEVQLSLDIGVKNYLKQALLKGDTGLDNNQDAVPTPQVILKAHLPDVSVNMSPDIYNGLINIKHVLQSSSIEEELKQLKFEKDRIIESSYYQNSILTRGVRGFNSYWFSYYVVLSGSYIYFYKSRKELMPYHYIYVSECQHNLNVDQSELHGIQSDYDPSRSVIYLVTSKGEKIFFSFESKREQHYFIQELVSKQQELLGETNFLSRRQDNVSEMVHKNPKELGLTISLVIGQIQLKVWNSTEKLQQSYKSFSFGDQEESDLKQWLVARVKDLDFSLNLFVYEAKIRLKSQSISISETHQLNQDIVVNEEGKNLFEVDIDIFNIYSPNIDDAEIIIKVFLGRLFVLFEPVTVNKAIRFFRNTKSYKNVDVEFLKHQLMDEDNSEQVEVGKKQIQTCKNIKLLLNKTSVSTQGLCVVAVHPDYLTPFFEIEVGGCNFNYHMHYDHDVLEGKFVNCKVFDLTNYPKTLQPSQQQKASIANSKLYTRQEIIGIRTQNAFNDSEESNEIYLKVLMTTENCPLKTSQHTSNVLVEISQIKVIYIYELALRIQDYFMDKFLWAITETDPYKDQLISDREDKSIKFSTMSKDQAMIFNIEQERSTSQMMIKVHRPYVILKDRPYSETYLEIDLGEIRITNEEIVMTKRFKEYPDKELFMNKFNMNGEDLGIKYRSGETEFQVSDSFDLDLQFSMLSFSKLFRYIDSHELDKSYLIKIQMNPFVNLKLKQDIYTYILKVLDLNLAYTDSYEEQFDFKTEEEYFRSQDQLRKFLVQISSPNIIFNIYEQEKLFSELAVQDAEISIESFLNKRYDYRINIDQINSFYNVNNEIKQLLFGNLTQLHRIPIENDFKTYFFDYEDADKQVIEKPKTKPQLSVYISMYPTSEKDFKVELNKVKLFVHPYFFLMLYNFFTEGLPQYDAKSFDQPNNYSDDVELSPDLHLAVNLRDTLLCFASESQSSDPSPKTIACQALVEFEFKREKIRKIKKQIFNKYINLNNTEQDQLPEHVQLPIQWMRIQIQEACPFICDLSELEMIDFKEMKKRQVISPFNFSHFFARYLRLKVSNLKLDHYEKSETKVDKLMVKISYQDFKLLTKLGQECFEGLEKYTVFNDEYQRKKKLGFLSDRQSSEIIIKQDGVSKGQITTYSKSFHRRSAVRGRNTITEQEEEKGDGLMQMEQPSLKSKSSIMRKGKDSDDDFVTATEMNYDKLNVRMQKIYSQGVQVVVINDYNNTFSPILSFHASSFQYKMQDEQDKKVGETILKGMVSYYNAKADEWEPFIEKAKIHYLSDSYRDQNFLLVSFKNDFNINFTTEMMQILIDTYMSLSEKEKDEQQLKMLQREQMKQSLQTSLINANYAINNSMRMSMNPQQMPEIKAAPQNLEYKVTPYSIRNNSSKVVKITRVFKDSVNRGHVNQSSVPKEYIIQPGQQVDYEVDYEEEAKTLMRISREELIKKSDFVNVTFNNGEGVLKNVNLRDHNYYHHLFSHRNKEDYIGYMVCFEKMRKVFMIRSPFVFNNKTEVDYLMRIYSEDGKQMLRLIELKPDASFPIDVKDYDKKFSISSALTPDEWSNSIKFRTIIEKVPKNTTTYLYHGMQFSIICKEKSEIKKNLNINIKPPVQIINALPFSLRIKTDFIKSLLPENMRFQKKGDNGQPETEMYEYETQEFSIGKGQQLKLFNFNLKSAIHFLFTLEHELNSETQGIIQERTFQWAEVNIPNTEFKTTKMFIIKDADNPQSTLEVYVKLDHSERAGVKIIFYVQNVILNNTDQKLMIYYDKRMLAAGQLSATDNSIIPLSNRQKAIACIETSDLKKSMSSPFVIDIAGVTNILQIQRQQYSFFEFTVKTELSLASNFSSLKLIANDEEIYTKVTTISPAYVIYNKMKKTILVKQDEQRTELQVIPSGQRQAFHWTDIRKAKFIQFKCVEIDNAEYDDDSHDWSFKFSLNEIGRISVFNRNIKQPDKSKHVLVEKELQEHNQILFVCFSEENPKFPTYKLENNTQFLRVEYYQKDMPHNQQSLLPKSSTTFSWTNPIQNQEITCTFFRYPQIHGSTQHFKFDFQLDNLDLNQTIQVPDSYQIPGAPVFHVFITSNGFSKILTISDISLKQQLEKRKEEEIKKRDYVPKQTINIQLQSMGVSFILTTPKKIRKEFIFTYFEGIKFIIIDTQEKREVQLKVAYAQCDNNLGQKLIFPVIMYPRDLVKKRDKMKKAIRDKKGGHNEEIKDFFNSHILMRKDLPDVVFLEQAEFLVQTIILLLDDELIGHIFKFIADVTDSLQTNIMGVHDVFKPLSHFGFEVDWNLNEEIEAEQNLMFDILSDVKRHSPSGSFNFEEEKSNMLQVRSHAMTQNNNFNSAPTRFSLAQPQVRPTAATKFGRESLNSQSNIFSKISGQSWLNYNIEAKGKKLYIKQYKSSPIDIELSFLTRGKMELAKSEKDFSVADKFRIFGLTLANVDKAQVRINSLTINNIFGTPNEISYKLSHHYLQLMKENLFTIVGSSNILGSPANFVNHMGTGVHDFFYKPIEGIINGPLEGGKGLIEGTSSLIKNTVQGTFGSASKVLSSVSKGLLFITDDYEFIKQREEENMDKPKNVLEGVGFGLKSTFTGIASGITGVFENPIRGAQDEGLKGLAKGTYKGVSGLIVKPISGALDFFSKTSEGIKNQASSDDKVVHKIRTMRPFYGKQQLLKVYDDFHAYVMQHLKRINRGAYQEDHFVDAFYHATATETLAIVLTEEHFIVVDSKTKDVVKEFHSQNMVSCKREGSLLKIFINDVRLQGLFEQGAEVNVGYEMKIEDEKLIERYQKKFKTYIYHISIEKI